MSTNTVQTSINAVSAQIGFWVPSIGNGNEPALTAANEVLQVMTSPPFRFPWNRNSLTFTTVVGTQDYLVNVTDFGFAEKVSFQLGSGQITDIAVLNSTPLSPSSDQQQPVKIAVQLNTVGTSVSFRFLGVPDQIYTIVVTYQKFVPLITTLAATWAPVPDYLSYIYNRGFLARLYEGFGDHAAAQQQKMAFAAALLATAEGLTDTERNIFLSQYLVNPRTMESLQLKTTQGVQARGQ